MRPLRAKLQEEAAAMGIGIQIVEKDYANAHMEKSDTHALTISSPIN